MAKKPTSSLRISTTNARGFLTLFLLFCSASFVAAQSNDYPRAEFFAGYSVLAANYEVETRVPFIPVITAFDGKQTLKKGFNVSATGYLIKGFGLTGDFSAHFKTNRTPSALGGNIETRIRVFNVTGGPQYKFRNNSRLTPFVRALAGVAVTRSTLAITRNNLSDTSSSTDLALMMGGGLDVRVNNRVDLRVFQADYNPIFLRRGNELGFGESRADNVRYSFGVVFK
ncbi:MAG TPA: outer membrane beta-barrel protein [Pyrinomonadaceae bacterium]|nr:outer membrane beta-barrel protein [Pyrinomonadaceae bacterium]